MKQKIKAALKQVYNSREKGGINLGLGDDAFERVASVAETFITDEASIDDFVNKISTLNLLKGYQAEADKVRTELNDKIKGLEARLSEQGTNQDEAESKQEQSIVEQPQPTDIAAIIANAVAEGIKPLQDELNALKSENKSKTVVSEAKTKYDSNDYVKNYANEASDAWERAFEIYEATGSSMTADELHEKAIGYFNKLVSRKGVDTTKPFEAKGDNGPVKEADFSALKSRLQSQGKLPQE